MWMMLSVGMGLLLVLYSREWYARFGTFAYNNINVRAGVHCTMHQGVKRGCTMHQGVKRGCVGGRWWLAVCKAH